MDVQRERILAIAERLVALHGFDRLRLRDIADEAGLSIGALQHHFDTRDKLLKAAFMWSCERRIAFWQANDPSDDEPWARLRALLERVFAVDDFRLHSTIWAEYSASSFRDEELRAVMAEVYEQWRRPLREAVQAGVDAGVFTPVASVDDVVNMLSAQIDGLELASIIAPSGIEPATLPRLLLGMAAAILRAVPD